VLGPGTLEDIAEAKTGAEFVHEQADNDQADTEHWVVAG
jgi:hypothetical protein